MQKLLFLLCTFSLLHHETAAQRDYYALQAFEIGVQAGTSHFLGDLGGGRGIGRPFIRDTDFSAIRPALGLFGRYNVGANFSARLDFNYVMLSGDDKFTGDGTPPELFATEWYRYYRNLSFRSRVFEMSLSSEVVPYNFVLGRDNHVIAPYLSFGLGIMNFNPQAEYEGEWVDLQPLGTEGQNNPSLNRRPYRLTEAILPLGFGAKWTYMDTWTLSLEVTHRVTFTDYIDDVSTTYVSADELRAGLPADAGNLAVELANRTDEVTDYPGRYPFVAAPNAQRGDPKDNDSYYTITLRFGYVIEAGALGGGGRTSCPAW